MYSCCLQFVNSLEYYTISARVNILISHLIKFLSGRKQNAEQELRSFSFIFIFFMRLPFGRILWLLENTFLIAANVFLLLLLHARFRWTQGGRRKTLSCRKSKRTKHVLAFTTDASLYSSPIPYASSLRCYERFSFYQHLQTKVKYDFSLSFSASIEWLAQHKWKLKGAMGGNEEERKFIKHIAYRT